MLDYQDRQCLSGGQIDDLIRSILREATWCKLVGADGTYLHFGYDYYLYFGTNRQGIAVPPPPPGIYYEDFISPYASSDAE